MTTVEKLAMYKEKGWFISQISKVFEQGVKGSTVEKITYEVYSKEALNGSGTYYSEWIVVHFVGGGLSPRFVSGNSNTANLRIIGEMLDGGYYDEVITYQLLSDNRYKKVEL